MAGDKGTVMRPLRLWDKEYKIYNENYHLRMGPNGVIENYQDGTRNETYIPEEYTGKDDINGIKIFEGSRCTAYYDRQYIEGPIIYKNCAYWIHWEDKDIWLGSDTVSQVEVIGHIHDA